MISKSMLWRLAPLAFLVAIGCVAPTANVPESGSRASRTTSKAKATEKPDPQSTATAEPTATPTASTTATPTATPTASATATPDTTATDTTDPDDTATGENPATDTTTPAATGVVFPAEAYKVDLLVGGRTDTDVTADTNGADVTLGLNDSGVGMAIVPKEEDGTVSLIYFTDAINQMIRVLNGTQVQWLMGGPDQTTFMLPRGAAYDATRKLLYVADTGKRRILRFGLTGNQEGVPIGDFQVIAGTATGDMPSVYRDGPGKGGTTDTEATFHTPVGLALGPNDSALYVVDQGFHSIRKIDLNDTDNFTVTTLAGGKSTTPGTPASVTAETNVEDARFNNPSGIALGVVAGVPHLFVADTGNHVIRSLSLNTGGKARVHAGTLATGSRDGAHGNAQFDNPIAVVADGVGNVYVGEAYNYRVRRINTDRSTVTLAGGATAGYLNGDGNLARFGGVTGLAIDTQSDGQFRGLYVYDIGTDTEAPRIRKITKKP